MEYDIEFTEKRLNEAESKLQKAFAAAEADLKTIDKKIPAQFHKDRQYLDKKIKEYAEQLKDYRGKHLEGSLSGFTFRRFNRLKSDVSFLSNPQLQWLINKLDVFVETSEASDGLSTSRALTSSFGRRVYKFPEI